MINFGDWRETEQLEGANTWQDPHHSDIADLGRKLDVMTYVPGLNWLPNKVHDLGTQVATGVNRYASPVVGGLQQVNRYVNPWIKTIEKHAPGVANYIQGVEDYARNKPGDTAAIIAAAYFTGGAAASAFSGGGAAAGAAAAPAASGGAGAAGGLGAGAEAGIAAAAGNAITPAFASGAAGGSIAGASAGTGTLGAAGTAALESAIPATFTGLGASSGYGALFDTVKSYANTAKRYKSVADYANQNSGINNDRNRATMQSNNLANAIINNNDPVNYRARIINKIHMNKFGMR